MTKTRTNSDVAAALYVFMGWLTTRDETLTLGATHDAAPAAEVVGAFCEWNDISDPDMASIDYKHPAPILEGSEE